LPIDVEVELGTGTFDLTDLRMGLADLSSYQQTLTVSFVGTNDGSPHEWTQTRTFVHTEEPLGSMLTIESSGDIDAANPAVVAETAGALYESFNDGSCTGGPIEAEDSLLTLEEPVGLLAGLLGAEEAGTDRANDVAALYYTFDERAMGELGRAETDGEVWVAVDGGYVLRYVRTTGADAAYFGEGLEGTVTWAYDLTGIDQLPGIVLPPRCQIDAPKMEDATNLQVLPEWMGFDTPSSISDVTAFYEEQLPARGWTRSGDQLIAPETEFTNYSRGDELMTVIATVGDTGARVNVLLSSASE
jgi:hypothetical protein